MKISIVRWLKEYAIAYILGLVLALSFYVLFSVVSQGWERGLVAALNSKVIIMLLTGSVMFAGLVLKASLLGQTAALLNLVLILGFMALPFLFSFIKGNGKRKILWVIWSLVWGVISLSFMGIALPLAVPV